jgi:hypothetical protein
MPSLKSKNFLGEILKCARDDDDVKEILNYMFSGME